MRALLAALDLEAALRPRPRPLGVFTELDRPRGILFCVGYGAANVATTAANVCAPAQSCGSAQGYHGSGGCRDQGLDFSTIHIAEGLAGENYGWPTNTVL